MADKAVELNISFKEATLDFSDEKFSTTLQETLDAVKAQLTDARVRYKQTKVGTVTGLPTLQEKGVEVGIKFTF
jgi:hypothetical protein